MAKTQKQGSINEMADYQSVQIVIDPKTQNLDKTAHDILLISELVAELLPSARMKSMDIRDYFAVVKVAVPQKLDASEAVIRLYQLNDTWKVRGCAFSKKQPSRVIKA